jgi:hypothetical protein
MKALLSLFLLIMLPVVAGASSGQPRNKSLVAVVNLVDHATKHKWLYKMEDSYAGRLIERKTKKHYDDFLVLKKDQATLKNFLQGLKDLAAKNPDNQIDVIFYIHGHSPSSPGGAALCFAGQTACVPVNELSQMIREAIDSSRLGYLYSDACWGSTHLSEMMNAGFKVAAGTLKVDANHTSDLRRFLKSFNQGHSFQEAIDFANRNPLTKIKDAILDKDADSFKVVMGDKGYRWNKD